MEHQDSGGNGLWAALGALAVAIFTGFFKLFRRQITAGERENLGMARVHTSGTQDIMDRYERQIDAQQKRIDELEDENRKLRQDNIALLLRSTPPEEK